MDLLLYLVKKQEVDIYEVNLTRIATEFIDYIEVMRQLDLEVAGEFLVMAATLMYIKSRELLPKEKRVETDVEEEEDDPRWELIRQLVEYKKFKEAADHLQVRELEQENVYPRRPAKAFFEENEEPPSLQMDGSVFDLIKAVNMILKRFDDRPTTKEIQRDRWTVSLKLEVIRDRIKTEGRFLFTELFEEVGDRSEVIVTFLAVLEMIRLRQLKVEQSETFGEIDIIRRDADDDEAVESATQGSDSEAFGLENQETSFSQ